MKTRKPSAPAPRRKRAPHPLRAQLLLYREAVRRLKNRKKAATAELPIDEVMISET